MLPADAAGGGHAMGSSPRKLPEVEAAKGSSGPTLLGNEAGGAPFLTGAGPEAGGGPSPPSSPGPPKGCLKKVSPDLASGSRVPTLPLPLARPEPSGADGLFRSLAEEPYETVFADPPGCVEQDVDWGCVEPPRDVDCCAVRNLDTNEVRFLGRQKDDADVLTVSFIGEQVDPTQLRRRSARPWRWWWSDKKSKDRCLREAAEAGDSTALRKVLEPCQDGAPPASVNARSSTGGLTALHGAAAAGHADSVRDLLSARADLSARTEGGDTALHLAARRGEPSAVQALLAAQADVLDADGAGNLPIHLASAGGSSAVVSLLLGRPGSSDQLRARNGQRQRAAEACASAEVALRIQQHADSWSLSLGSDSYAARTPVIMGGDAVLLRNSRSDAVRRLLGGGSVKTGDGPSASAASGAKSLRFCSFGLGNTPRAAGSARTQSSFTASYSGRTPGATGSRTPGAASQTPRASGTGTPRVRQPFARVRSGSPEAETIGPSSFELMCLLGRGSFGEVFQVRHKRTDEVYAMKVLQKSRILSSNLLRYAVTERNILAYIKHPYIVSLHYAFQTQSHLVLVLQYCPRGNLQQLLTREGRLQEPLARLYTAEVLLALIHLHVRSTVFRDLKPDNVVIDAAGHAMLTDFGLSKEGVLGQRGTKSFCGSVAFLAPEILLRRGHGHTVDIYNLGVLLFDMLTGLPPFYHPDRETLFANIKHARLVVPQYVPRTARTLIEALMEREPSRRLGAASTADVQKHAYFADTDFGALMRREVPVPASTSWRSWEGRTSPRCTPSPFGRADRAAGLAAGWRARHARPGGRRCPGADAASGAVSNWEFAAVPPPAHSGSACRSMCSE